jgi:hypothetical protein
MQAERHGRAQGRVRRAALKVTAGAALTGAAFAGVLASAPPANAWPWSPKVILGGSIQCPAWGGPFDNVAWMWVAPNYSSSGFANHRGAGRVQQYQFTLDRVPGGFGYDGVLVRYGCTASGTHETSFGVNRPKVGEYQTRNIY